MRDGSSLGLFILGSAQDQELIEVKLDSIEGKIDVFGAMLEDGLYLLDIKLDAHGETLSALEGKLDALEGKLDEQFYTMESKLDTIEGKLDAQAEWLYGIEGKLDQFLGLCASAPGEQARLA